MNQVFFFWNIYTLFIVQKVLKILCLEHYLCYLPQLCFALDLFGGLILSSFLWFHFSFWFSFFQNEKIDEYLKNNVVG